MKLIYSLLLSLVTIGAAAQQKTVTGRVLDSETKEGEIGAIVQFLDPAAGKAIAFTAASEDGSFAQKLKGGKDYKILVSNMGRKDIEKDFHLGAEDLDLGEFLMENDATQLDAATVTSQKTLVKMEVDKMSYNVAEDTDSKTSTVLDMLRKVPMVTVDAQDNITVNGSSSFIVTVDGKPNQMLTKNAATVFKMMPASSIKGIEVITNPGVKYDAEGVGGVLNLITEKVPGGGSSVADGQYGSLNLAAGTRNANVGGMLTMQRGKFSFSLNGNFGKNYNQDILTETDIKNLAFSNNTYGNTKSKGSFGWGDIQMSYEPDTLNLISVNADGFRYSRNDDSFTTNTNPAYTRNNTTKSSFTNFDIGADWQHSFADAPGRMLTVSYKGGFNPGKDKDLGLFSPESIMYPSRRAKGKTNSEEHTFQTDLTSPLGKNAGSLSTGLKFVYRNNNSVEDVFLRNGGDFAISDANCVDYKYTNKIGAAYVEYSGTFGKVGVKAGGRYEHTWQEITYKKNGNDYSTNYGSFVPSASIQYSLSQIQNIGLSYNMRISRPGISYLNPYVNESDPNSITYGNPNLDIAKSHNISLVYNFYSPVFMMNATLTQNFGTDGISEYTYSGDNGVLYTTYGNILKEKSTRLSLFGNINLGKTTRIYANLSGGYQDMRSSKLGYKKGIWEANAFIGAQQTIFWDLRLSENLFLMPKRRTLQTTMSSIQGLVLSVTKTFLDDQLSVTVTGVSPLNMKKNMNITLENHGTGYDMVTKVHVPMQQAMISLTWNFGKSSFRVKKANRTIQNDDVLNKSADDSAAGAAGSMTGSGR